MLSYYQILGLKPKASYQEIRKRYRELVIKYHPDRNLHLQGKEYLEIQEKFKKIVEAYNILSDSRQRKRYDHQEKFRSFASEDYKYSFTIPDTWYNFINDFFEKRNQKNSDSNDNSFSNNNNNNNNINQDVTNMFRQFMEGKFINQDNFKSENLAHVIKACKFFYQNFQNKYPVKNTTNTTTNRTSTIIHRPREKKVPTEKVNDTIINANAKLEDIYNGIKKTIEVPTKTLCPECQGLGYLGIGRNMILCGQCRGLMFNHQKIPIEINLAKSETIFYGKGDQEVDKISGNIVIKITPKEDSTTLDYTILNNYDLLLPVNLELKKFYTGGNHIIKLPNGKDFQFEVIPTDELRQEKEIILRGQGLLIEDSDRRGDLYLDLNVILPNTLENLVDN